VKKKNGKGKNKKGPKKQEKHQLKSDSCLKIKRLKLRPETLKSLGRKRFRKIRSLRDLANLGTQAVLQIPGIGPGTLDRLQKHAQDHDIRWNFSEHEKARHASLLVDADDTGVDDSDDSAESDDVSLLGMM